MQTEEILARIYPQPIGHSGTQAKIDVYRQAMETAMLVVNDVIPEGRYKAMAFTAIEEAVVWGVKGIAHNQ